MKTFTNSIWSCCKAKCQAPCVQIVRVFLASDLLVNVVGCKISGLSQSTALFVESLMVAVFLHWDSQRQKLQCQEVNSFKGDLLGAPDFIRSSNSMLWCQSMALGFP